MVKKAKGGFCFRSLSLCNKVEKQDLSDKLLSAPIWLLGCMWHGKIGQFFSNQVCHNFVEGFAVSGCDADECYRCQRVLALHPLYTETMFGFEIISVLCA